MHGQIALIKRAGVGVRFAADGPLLRGVLVDGGVERRANAGGVVGRPRKLDVYPVVAVGRNVAEEDLFVKDSSGRGDQILVAVQVDIRPGAVVGAFVGVGETLSRSDVGKLPAAVVAIELSGRVLLPLP